MDPTEVIAVIDGAVKLITFISNAVGANNLVANTIAARIAAGRDWTDAEKQAITDSLAANKAYAQEQLTKPDTP